MIAIEISMKPHVAKYLQRLYGPEMKLSPRKDLVNRMLYYLMRDNLHEDRRYEKYQAGYTARYKVLVPKRLVIDRGARSLSAFCTSELNASIDELIKKEFYEYMLNQVAAGVMRRDAIYNFREKHGFSEDELAFETLKKAFYRYELNSSKPLHAPILSRAS